MVRLSEHFLTTTCPECGSHSLELDEIRGELHCKDCGFIIIEKGIDLGPDWMNKGDRKKNQSRIGPTRSIWSPESTQSTEIGWRNTDSKGVAIPAKNLGQVYRLRKWQRRLRHQTTSKKNLITGFKGIERLCTNMGIPKNTMENAKVIFKRASDLNLIQGRGIECMVATVVYLACREYNIPRTLNEISEETNVNRKDIGRASKILMKKLDFKLKIVKPSDYIIRFCSKLQLEEITIRKCLELIHDLEEAGYTSGKNPSGLAASVIYISSNITNKPRTQAEISEVSGISEVTIRKRYQEMMKILKVNLTC